jgi:hypothetical protein
MSLGLTIVVLVLLALALIAGLALVMSRPTRLRPHRPRGGRPAARMRWRRQARGNRS